MLDAPNQYRLIEKANENSIPQLIELFSSIELKNEDNIKKYNKKISPIIRKMHISDVEKLYKELQVKTNDEKNLEYLQVIFVEHILHIVLHDPTRGRAGSSKMWTYEQICKFFLNEEPINNADKNKTKNR